MKEKMAGRQGCIDEWIGDDICDDENNNNECQFDGGDCCGANVDTTWCTACECLEGGCQFPSWFADGYCDDENNTPDCDFDGGDCCLPNVDTTYCSDCLCLEPDCEVEEWIGDGYCDDNNNYYSCGWDGGDCCPFGFVGNSWSVDSWGWSSDSTSSYGGYDIFCDLCTCKAPLNA